VTTAHKHGVKNALGTDAGMPGVDHAGSAREMEYMCQAGLSPMESIVAATRNAADCCCMLEQTGTLETGKLADLIVVRGDPLADIRSLQDHDSVLLVAREGTVFRNTLVA